MGSSAFERRTARSPIVCLEGPSAVGKTTLAAALARDAGAALVPEPDARNAPPDEEAAAWFAEQHVAQWRLAVKAAESRPVVIDGDPFKGLWFNWIMASQGWPGVDATAALYRERLRSGSIGFPDRYVVLGATEAQLRTRRAADPTRTRRHFEQNLGLVVPQRRYFAALAAAAPERVLFLDTTARDGLAAAVIAEMARAERPSPPDDEALFDRMVAWLRAQEGEGSATP